MKNEVAMTLSLTLAAAARHGWQIVLLRRGGTPGAKRPDAQKGQTWRVTIDPATIRGHVESGKNIGLVCGSESGVAVPDADDAAAFAEMRAALGHLVPWVATGSGGRHFYVRWEPGLVAKLTWDGRRIGEVQRGGVGPDGAPLLQHVVLPPSIHPNGEPYSWCLDPSAPLPTLPAKWRAVLVDPDTASASHTAENGSGAGENDPFWRGQSATELLAAALGQPGAKRRTYGVKFQCPACRRAGHDKTMDNAVVRLNGRWGCAYDSSHNHAVGKALGYIAPKRDILYGDPDALFLGVEGEDRMERLYLALRRLRALDMTEDEIAQYVDMVMPNFRPSLNVDEIATCVRASRRLA